MEKKVSDQQVDEWLDDLWDENGSLPVQRKHTNEELFELLEYKIFIDSVKANADWTCRVKSALSSFDGQENDRQDYRKKFGKWPNTEELNSYRSILRQQQEYADDPRKDPSSDYYDPLAVAKERMK